MILFDTGVLVALANRRDDLHERAAAAFRNALLGTYGQLVSTDYVLDEGLTLIRTRMRDKPAAQAFSSLFFGARDARVSVLEQKGTGLDLVEEASELFFRHGDRGLSFTDCTLIAHAKRLDAVVATFDPGFDGLVATIEI